MARVLLGQSVSAQSGRTPAEIEQSCALEVVALRPGSLEMLLDLPQSRQLSFTDDLGEQSLQHLVQGIGAVGQATTLPRGFDRGVADALVSGGRLFDRGINKISFSLHTRTQRIASTYTPEVRQTLQSYPRPQRITDNLATIEGKLLMGDFKETSLKCRIDPPIGGRSITCTFDESQKNEVLRALTRYVRVVGEASEQEGQLQTLRIRNIEILDDPTSKGGPYLREPVTAYPFFNPPQPGGITC